MISVAPKKLYFIHVGKTGGTYLGSALRALKRKSGLEINFTSHAGKFRQIVKDPDAMVMFGIRDPLAIFVSGFYSRQRKGAPRYHVEWSSGEAEAFGRFSTANQLAEALSSEDGEERSAAQDAMAEIRHVNGNLCRYLQGPNVIKNHQEQVFYIFRQSDLDHDLATLYKLCGKSLPKKVSDNEDLRHKNPASIDRTLSETAVENLKSHYRKDIRLFDVCMKMHRETTRRAKDIIASSSS